MTRRVVVGAALGLVWGFMLRGWMIALALHFGDQPVLTWKGTFGAILLPTALVGALLGWAYEAAENEANQAWRWVLLAPLLLILGPVLVTENFISTLVSTGMGGGAIGVFLIGLLGGYAFSGLGARWLRWLSGLLSLVMALGLVFGVYLSDEGIVAAADASVAFGVLMFMALMALLVAGVSAPFRHRARLDSAQGRSD